MRNFSLVIFTLFSVWLSAQTPFTVTVEPVSVPGFTGVQSFVSATYNDYLLIIGGRQDGLHERQPFASFRPEGNNTIIQLLQPETGEHYAASLSGLPEPLREQLQSTNMEFYQDGDQLYIIGGYGYSPSMGDHITYAQLTVVDIPVLAEAILNEGDLSAAFRYTSDYRMAVTGGYLGQLQDTFYLVGGHRFTGRYNPHNGPSFEQEYTNQVRKFTVETDGSELTVGYYEAWTDEMQLHRRDYNLAPQVFPDSKVGFTAFSGVFQHAVDLPFLNTVDILPGGYAVNNNFEQYLNHYHCGTAPLYDAASETMYTVFFGGMSQFVPQQDGSLLEDQEVPFVNTVGCVSRNSDGSMMEEKVGELPALLGAGSEFIATLPASSLSKDIYPVNMAELSDSLFIGYLVGGIESSAPNIFFINDGTQSEASNGLYRVYLKPVVTTGTAPVEREASLSKLQLSPNPATTVLSTQFELQQAAEVRATFVDSQGRIVRQISFGRQPAGEQQHHISLENLPAGSYWLNISARQSQLALPFIRK